MNGPYFDLRKAMNVLCLFCFLSYSHVIFNQSRCWLVWKWSTRAKKEKANERIKSRTFST